MQEPLPQVREGQAEGETETVVGNAMTCLNPSGEGASSPACSLDTGLQLWGLRGARLVPTGFGCVLGNLAGAGAQILPNPTGIHSAVPCVGTKGHHQGLGSQGPPCQAGAWPSSAPWPIQGGSLQGGFQRAGKQRPDGTQIPAQRHPPSWVCTALVLICSGEGFSLSCTSATVPGRHPEPCQAPPSHSWPGARIRGAVVAWGWGSKCH